MNKGGDGVSCFVLNMRSGSMNLTHITITFISLATISLALGCAGPTRKAAVPVELTDHVVIPGMENVRYRLDRDQDLFFQESISSYYKEVSYKQIEAKREHLSPADFLAIYDDGDNGALGAGLLCGWTKAGTRPEFKLVTNVSTGALTAPFAFLGPMYDIKLKEFYTMLSREDIMTLRSPLAAIISDAMADNAPLQKLIEKEITPKLLQAISGEYKKGRLLLIATLDLDSRQTVLWNMTRISASDAPLMLLNSHLQRS